jgi:hypothetical protein
MEGGEREPAAERSARKKPTFQMAESGRAAGRAQARTPEPRRATPSSGTIYLFLITSPISIPDWPYRLLPAVCR